MRFTEHFTVAGTPDAVLAYAADFRNLPEWDPSIVSVALTDGKALTVGSHYRVDLRFVGLPAQLDYETQEFAPGRRAVLRAGNAFCTAVDSVEVKANGKRTRVTWNAEISFLFPMSLLDPLFTWAFRSTVDGAVAGLRRRLQALPAA